MSNNQVESIQANYQQLIDTLGDVVFTVDLDGYLTYINHRVRVLLGYSPEHLLGQHYERIIDPRWCDHVRTQYASVLHGGQAEVVLETPLRSRQQQEIWVEQVITPLRDTAGQVQGLAGVMRDLTGRNHTEAELERRIGEMATLQRIDAELTHALEIEYVASMALDTAVRLSAADAGGIDLLYEGKMYTGAVIGKYPEDFVKQVPKPQVGIVKRVLQRRKPELILDVSQDPDYYPFIPDTQAQMTIPLLSQDRLVGVLFLETRRPEKFTQEVFGFIQLITTRIAVAVDNAQLHATTRQQLAELQDLYTQISQLEQLKTDMIRIAAHDLGNPLTSVSASIDFLLDSELDERQAEYAHLIKESGQRMKKIIRDILSLQRIEELAQGQLTEAVDLAALAQEVYRTQSFGAAHKNQDFRLDVPDYPAIIVGDEAQLREAIANLLGNAIKYTPEGGSIRARVWEEDDFFLFEVQDNGYGIPADQQERMFQPFFRAQMPETRKIDGTGLGLHLVKNIIERHRGKMRFYSVYGQGSIFGFEIPIPM